MIDLGWLGQIAFTWEFFAAVMSIVLIDLVLAGDNAVVIAMAVKNLPGKTRQWGIVLGAGGAVVIRVLCTFLVAQLLNHVACEAHRRGADHLDCGEAAHGRHQGRVPRA